MIVSLSPSFNALDIRKMFQGAVSGFALGSQIDEVMAKIMKTTPPTSVTKRKLSVKMESWGQICHHLPVRTEIF